MGTVGQAAIGISTGAPNNVYSGFWYTDSESQAPQIGECQNLIVAKFLPRGKKIPESKPVTDVSTINTETVIDGSSNPYLKRYIDDEQWIKSWRDRGGRGKKIAFFVWELTSHCGRSIGLWAAWSLFFILLFSVILTPSPHWWPDWWWGFWRDHGVAFQQTAPAYIGKPVGFWSCLYFSIVNFTTLGFGDIVAANGLARFCVAFKVVLGYVMLGGLISIFANKFARRIEYQQGDTNALQGKYGDVCGTPVDAGGILQ